MNNSVVLNKGVGGIFFSLFVGENTYFWEFFNTYIATFHHLSQALGLVLTNFGPTCLEFTPIK